MALFVALAAANAALLALRLADGGLPVARPWLAVALVHEDVRLVVAFGGWVALVAAITRRWPGAARASSTAVVIVYAALAFWTAFNVPVN
jgi:hypothetical protein